MKKVNLFTCTQAEDRPLSPCIWVISFLLFLQSKIQIVIEKKMTEMSE